MSGTKSKPPKIGIFKIPSRFVGKKATVRIEVQAVKLETENTEQCGVHGYPADSIHAHWL